MYVLRGDPHNLLPCTLHLRRHCICLGDNPTLRRIKQDHERIGTYLDIVFDTGRIQLYRYTRATEETTQLGQGTVRSLD